jgi:ATP-dependent Lon protease
VPENLRKAMKLHFVDTMDQVLALALERALPELPVAGTQPMAPLSAPAPEQPSAHQ